MSAINKYHRYRNRGIRELKQQRYQAAKECFLQCVKTNAIHPADSNVPQALYKHYLKQSYMSAMFYNIACCECHLGELESAQSYLRQALQLGFYNVDLVETDPDLKPLNSTSFWTWVLETCSKIRNDPLQPAQRLPEP